MQVTDGKVYATLTEVKNLIGDVFSAVDKYGEVTITSYNKPKYTISVVPTSLVEEVTPVAVTATPAAETRDDIVILSNTIPEIIPEIVEMSAEELPPVQIETTANVEIVEPEMEIIEPTVAETPIVETPVVAEVITEAKSQPIDLTQIFIGATDTEMWNRIGPREIAWVEKVRTLT